MTYQWEGFYMCRMAGIIANKEVDFHFSLATSKNSLRNQSRRNPDGWGIGYFEDHTSKVIKSSQSAFESEEFLELSQFIKSRIIISHVRYASVGSISKRNSHPFIYKNWIFAHNGTLYKEELRRMIKDEYLANLTSDGIDSELYFRYIVQNIEESGNIVEGIRKAVNEVLSKAYYHGANFIMSDGQKLYAFRYENPLNLLIRNPKTPVHYRSKETNVLIESKRLSNEKAIIIASERMTSDEEWQTLNDGELVVADFGKILILNNILD